VTATAVGGAVSDAGRSPAALPSAPARPTTRSTKGNEGAARDAFPHTRRPLPWALAAFLALLFFVPIDSTELKVHLPVGSQIDRFAVLGLVLLWICCGGDQRAFLRTRRSKLFVGAACVFLALASASLFLDVGRIVNIGDLTLAEKRFGLLGSFLVVAWFALTALRFEDVRGFSSYLIGLGAAMGIAMLIERHTGFNIFYEWSGAILKPIATVAASPTDIHPGSSILIGHHTGYNVFYEWSGAVLKPIATLAPNVHPEFGGDGRVVVVGPTRHGLAATTMLVVVMPFALVRVLEARSRRSLSLNAIAFTLMVTGAAVTERKTALLVPLVVVIYLACYRPRKVLRLAPAGLVALAVLVQFASPGSLGAILDPTGALSSQSSKSRVRDYGDVAPDVLARPLLGRGFGTLDEEHPTQFRINDNEYIDEIWEVGVVGLIAYVSMILAPVFLARRAIRGRDPTTSSLALAASAGCIAYLAVNELFDALTYPQAPYMFFIVAAVTTVVAAGPAGNVQPARERARQLIADRQARSSPVAEAA
jgi:hypothetical protein